jgi:hypothetical protein
VGLGPAAAAGETALLADFEAGFPVARGKEAGFRGLDRTTSALVPTGADGTKQAAKFFLGPGERSAFLQRTERRRYLGTGRTAYSADGPNALSFWLRVPPRSHLLSRGARDTFGVWTYHWDPGDANVGGANNTSGTTDSMMHGYANFRLVPEAADRWVRVVLSPSAFRQQRDYYHFFAARAVTGPLAFFPSLRQLQFTLLGKLEAPGIFELDQLALVTRPPTARCEPEYADHTADPSAGQVRTAVRIRNPTDRDRSYRVFISSFLGMSRADLNRVFARFDSIQAITHFQYAVGGRGGVGVAALVPKGRSPVEWDYLGQEIAVPAGGAWEGTLVHAVRPEMLGEWVNVEWQGETRVARRNTLTTSVIVWDPQEPPSPGTEYLRWQDSNTDNGNHPVPPGFPKQFRPPPGWRSGDVPLDQVGGYFVSEIKLESLSGAKPRPKTRSPRP